MNKKSLSRLFCVLLMFSIAVSTALPVFAISSAIADGEDDNYSETARSSGDVGAKMAKDTINKYYGEIDVAGIAWIGDTIEDENFGGLYLDDGENLVVNIANVAPKTIDLQSAPLDTEIRYNHVDYSLSELEAVSAALSLHMKEYGIILLDANDITNEVDIWLTNYSEANIYDIRAFLESAFPSKNISDMLNFVDKRDMYNSCRGAEITETEAVEQAAQRSSDPFPQVLERYLLP